MLKPGYKQTDIGVLPEEWAVVTLGELTFKVGSGITPTGGNKVYQNSGRPFVRSQNVGWGTLLLDDIAYISEEIHSTFTSSEIKENDVLLNITGASIGRSAMADLSITNGNVNQHVCIIRPNNKLLNPNYLCSFLLSANGQDLIDSFQTGGNRQGLNFEQIKSFIIPLPPLAEQQAIADTLGAVDALLREQRALLAKKRDLKLATQTALLTRARRLPGFTGEWQERTLGDVVRIKKGRLITEKTHIPGKIPVIAGGQTPAYFHNEANRKGPTITVSASGAYAGFVAFHDYPIFASDCSTIEESNGYDLGFIYSFLKSRQREIYEAQTGGAQPHIHAKDIEPMRLLLPPLPEQCAIAQLLTDLDAELAALAGQVAKTEALKQGLMQDLLTGTIRLREGSLSPTA